jgi:hypothetical protein
VEAWSVGLPWLADVVDGEVEIAVKLGEAFDKTPDVRLIASFASTHHVGVEADS